MSSSTTPSPVTNYSYPRPSRRNQGQNRNSHRTDDQALLRDINNHDARQLTKILRHGPSDDAIRYLNEVKERTERASPLLKRQNKLVDLFFPRSTKVIAPYCSLHKKLDPEICHSLFNLLQREVFGRLNPLRAHPELLTPEQRDLVRRLTAINKMWLSRVVFKDTFACDPRTLPSVDLSYEERECEACILARIGGNVTALEGLRIAVESRLTKRQKEGGRHGLLLRFLLLWLEHHSLPNEDKILAVGRARADQLREARAACKEADARAATRAKPKRGAHRSRLEAIEEDRELDVQGAAEDADDDDDECGEVDPFLEGLSSRHVPASAHFSREALKSSISAASEAELTHVNEGAFMSASTVSADESTRGRSPYGSGLMGGTGETRRTSRVVDNDHAGAKSQVASIVSPSRRGHGTRSPVPSLVSQKDESAAKSPRKDPTQSNASSVYTVDTVHNNHHRAIQKSGMQIPQTIAENDEPYVHPRAGWKAERARDRRTKSSATLNSLVAPRAKAKHRSSEEYAEDYRQLLASRNREEADELGPSTTSLLSRQSWEDASVAPDSPTKSQIVSDFMRRRAARMTDVSPVPPVPQSDDRAAGGRGASVSALTPADSVPGERREQRRRRHNSQRGFQVATDKPTPLERERRPHGSASSGMGEIIDLYARSPSPRPKLTRGSSGMGEIIDLYASSESSQPTATRGQDSSSSSSRPQDRLKSTWNMGWSDEVQRRFEVRRAESVRRAREKAEGKRERKR